MISKKTCLDMLYCMKKFFMSQDLGNLGEDDICNMIFDLLFQLKRVSGNKSFVNTIDRLMDIAETRIGEW